MRSGAEGKSDIQSADCSNLRTLSSFTLEFSSRSTLDVELLELLYVIRLLQNVCAVFETNDGAVELKFPTVANNIGIFAVDRFTCKFFRFGKGLFARILRVVRLNK